LTGRVVDRVLSYWGTVFLFLRGRAFEQAPSPEGYGGPGKETKGAKGGFVALARRYAAAIPAYAGIGGER